MSIQVFLYAQEIEISAPQKINAGISKVEVLGRNDQGILIRHTVHDDDEIICYYDNMSVRWKKVIPHREKNSTIEEIIIYPDSVMFFYSTIMKNVTVLKAFKTNARIETPTPSILCDTISRTLMNPLPRPQFVTTADKRFVLFSYNDHDFDDNRLVHLTCMNNLLRKTWTSKMRISGFEHPDVITTVIDTFGNASVIIGEYKARNFSNNFPYTALMISSIKQKGTRIHQTTIHDREIFYTQCEARPDARTGNILMSGLFSYDVGSESKGVYFFLYNSLLDSLMVKNYEAYSGDFLSQLTGNFPPKKNDAFYDFQPVDLIVKRDGGAIFVAESESVTSESYNNPPFGGFGLSTGFTVSYYHYDELAVMSFRPDGSVEWKQILHKKQSTEGDGGFYSSISTMIAPAQLYFVYNDVTNGQTTVSDFSVDATGKQMRNEIFSADRKGVEVAPRQGKQISANEMVLPSFKKNFLQFVKISF
ncbi:MAG TPA: hypothetical protein VE978_22475 [Chitinophagales bacterium]|nr:hypothetical protein [Chitinophagales bacterium]